MILDGENGERLMPQPGDGVVVKINMRDLYIVGQTVRIDRKTVIV
jgi:hypothetical protein